MTAVRATRVRAILGFALAMLIARPSDLAARGADDGPFLEWSAPAECPDSATIRRAVADHLQTDAVPLDLRVVARIARSARGSYALTLQLDDRGERAERRLSGNDCAALAEAAALLIAIAIDPNIGVAGAGAATQGAAVDSAPARSQRAEQSQAASNAPGADAGAAQAPAPQSSAPAEAVGGSIDTTTTQPGAETAASTPSAAEHTGSSPWGASLAFVVDAGSVPEAGLGAAAALDWHSAALRGALGARVLVPRETPLATLAPASIEIGGAMGFLKGCGRVGISGSLELGPCVEFELGALWGHALGIDDPRSGSALWAALGPALEIRGQLGAGLAAVVGAGLLLPAARQQFFVRTDQGRLSAHRVSAVVFRALLGVSYEFR